MEREKKGLFSTLGIALTQKCPARCRMCCCDCGPEKTQRLACSLMEDVIDQAGAVEGLSHLSFTGGEALLYAEDLERLARRAISLGLSVSVNTNGFWGRDAQSAREMAGRLKKAGVTGLAFSGDCFHQEYIPMEALLRALRTALDTGFSVTLSVMETAGGHEAERYQEALAGDLSRVRFERVLLFPAGRARDLPKELVRSFPAGPYKGGRCTYGGTLQLNYDGFYYLCCSPFFREIPLLKLGRAGELPLSSLPALISSRDELYVLLLEGPGWFADRAAELGLPMPERLTSACELCGRVLGSERVMEALDEQVRSEAFRLRMMQILK